METQKTRSNNNINAAASGMRENFVRFQQIDKLLSCVSLHAPRVYWLCGVISGLLFFCAINITLF